MNFLQNLFSAVGSFFSKANDCADGTDFISNKRPRSNDDEDEIIVTDDSPPKRQRFNKENQILSDITRRKLLRTSSATQTYPDFVIPKKADRLRGSCSSKSEENNWFEIDDDDSSLSPSKFKNLYKAPKHVRSPHKKHRVAMSFSAVSPSSNIMSVDLTVSPTEIDQPQASMRRNARTLGTSQFPSSFQWSSPPNGEMSHGAYERLLGSVISMSAKESMRSPQSVKPKKNITIVDLTDDDDCKTEIPTVDLTNRMGRLHKFNNLSRKSRTPLVTPNVISIDEAENTSASIKVDRVNSFQKKLEGNRFTKPDLISKGINENSKQVERFLQLKSQYERKARCEAESVTATLHEIIEKRIHSHLKITESVLIEEEEEEIVTEKPVLTPQMMAKVQNAQSAALNPDQVLISKFKLGIKREDFMTLKNLNWLNDAIINFYMELIVERSGSEKKYPSVYAFSTFFFPGLKNGYDRVRRYTRKVDLFSKDIILVPIHLAVHWCMAKIDMKHKEIVYYDSMLSSNTQVLEMLMKYLISEHKDKKKEDFDSSGWTMRNDKDIPTQKNGSDCGVFACTFAEYSSRFSKFNFSQTDMPFMRSKMCYEILTGKLLL